MKTLCIIPARGGSKGLPRKNLREVGGVSLVERAVRTAAAATLVDLVAVSTEDAEIAAVARGAGAEVIDRPWELATDEAGTAETLLHGLRWMRRERECFPVLLVCVQCSCPFTAPDDVDATVRMLWHNPGIDSALTVLPAHMFLWRRGDDGQVRAVNHDPRHRQRRQTLGNEYLETGAVYATRVEGFEATGQIHHGRVEVSLQSSCRVLDIDNPHDLMRAFIWQEWADRQRPGQ